MNNSYPVQITPEQISKKVVALRHRFCFSQSYMAAALGLKRTTYAYREKCGCFTLPMLTEIAKIFTFNNMIQMLMFDPFKEDSEKTSEKLSEKSSDIPETVKNHSGTDFRLNTTEKSLINAFRLLSNEDKLSFFDYINELLEK